QHARKARSYPLLIELVSFFLLDAVVACYVEALAVVRLQIGIGWLSAKAAEIAIEVIFADDQGKTNVGMRIETLRHQHIGTEIHGTSPELAEQRALYFDV